MKLRILDPNGKPYSRKAEALFDKQARLRATYDSAQTSTQTKRHWAASDSYSADTANSYSVRKKIRERARYEVDNNSYPEGIAEAFALDVIGTGPRLQVFTSDDNLNDEIEGRWNEWAAAICLARKLRLLHRCRIIDGEAFGLTIDNPASAHAIKADLRILECDRFHNPSVMMQDNNIDGVIIDAAGNPIRYQVLKQHPGTSSYKYNDGFYIYLAKYVIHWFKQFRAEQHRGVSELRSVLEIFAYLRRWTLANLSAAESAADIALGLHTEAPASGETEDLEPLEAIELERGMMVTLPGGWKFDQVKTEQPPTTYPEYKKELVKEGGRPALMPLNIAGGDSSDSNMASGRLDMQIYKNGCRIHQFDLSQIGCDKLFYHFMREGRIIYKWPLAATPAHAFMWDSPQYVINKLQDARADAVMLENNMTTLAEVFGRRGMDWRKQLKQRQAEIELITKLGIAVAEEKPSGGNGSAGGQAAQAAAAASDIMRRI